MWQDSHLHVGLATGKFGCGQPWALRVKAASCSISCSYWRRPGMGPGHPFVGIKSYTEEQLRPRGRDCRSQGRTQSAAEGNGALVSEGTEAA